MKIRAVLIEEANELYDMGIIDFRKLVEWPFYAITRKDSLGLNQAQARIKTRGVENAGSNERRAHLIDAIIHAT